ncbi:MAG: methyl-accepting chemotaxis protein [bacterium]
MFKNMKLSLKLGCGFGLILILLTVIGGMCYVNFSSVDHLAHEVVEHNHLQTEILQKITDHVRWVSEVNDMFADDTVTTLTVQTDDRKCGFGQWLYGDEAREIAAEDPEIGRLLREVEGPHHRVHASAIKIKDSYKWEDYIKAQKIQDEVRHEWGRIAEKFTNALDRGMENVIDPAKEKAEQGGNIAAIVKWGEIDMEMNEGVIAPFLILRTEAANLAVTPTDEQWSKYMEQLETVEEGITSWASLIQGISGLNATLSSIQSYLTSFKEAGERYHNAMIAQKSAEASIKEASRIMQDETEPAAEETLAVLGKIRDRLAEMSDSATTNMGQKIDTTLVVVPIISLLAIIVGLFAGFIITRGIVNPLNKTVEMIQEMSDGHLDMRLNMETNDEIGKMAKAMDHFAQYLQHEFVGSLQKLAAGDLSFDAKRKDERDVIGTALIKMNNDLNNIMGQINLSVEQIASGSQQVSDSSQSVSQGATEQASSLEQITSSMNEMGSQTKQNAENANQANQLANEARSAAERGNAQMQDMVSAMGEINESGKNISKIIKVIDEIAFQTNLLALNAAVEAARAGKHGKGFAVVAEEVRNLAGRSAKAAKETAELIEGSVKKTENGADIANKTAEALNEILTGVTKASDLVGEIAAASNDQAQGIAQVNQGLGQIDQVTQQATANAEEGASAAEELSSQANQLKGLLQHFTLKNFQQQRTLYAAPSQTYNSQTYRPSETVSSLPSRNKSHMHEPYEENRHTIGVVKVDPKRIIALDDDEFGKY